TSVSATPSNATRQQAEKKISILSQFLRAVRRESGGPFRLHDSHHRPTAHARGGPFGQRYGKGVIMPNSILSRHIADKVLDLNDLRVFAYVASHASFSMAA